MPKRPRLNTANLEESVPRATGGFEQETLLPLTPEDKLDDMAKDPAYQIHCEDEVTEVRDRLALMPTDNPTPEEICAMREEIEENPEDYDDIDDED